MNALAKWAIGRGYAVSGSDQKLNDYTESLISMGADIWQGVNISRLKDVDIAVYSSAVPKDNLELVFLKRAGVRTYERQRFLYEVSRKFERVVAVSGTHGKTTVTAMLACILITCAYPVTAMIGGDSEDYGNYYSEGNSNTLVVEACEYKRNFLYLDPTVGIVTNVEWDHPDCYKNLGEVQLAFGNFLKKSKIKIFSGKYASIFGMAGIKEDQIAVCYDDKRDIFELEERELFYNGQAVGNIELSDGGSYNYLNAVFAIAGASAFGVSPKKAIASLASFKGVKRRFEKCGELEGAQVYFDFAHHPTEIACALSRAKSMGRVLAVFQPHTYSRLLAYLDDFAKVFSTLAGDVILMPVYAARERLIDGVESDALLQTIYANSAKRNVYLVKSADEALIEAKKRAKDYDVVMFLGAGDIYELRKFL